MAKHETLYIEPFPPVYKGKAFKYYQVAIKNKKPMATFKTLDEAVAFGFKYTNNLHISRAKHTKPDPKMGGHWHCYTSKEIDKIKQSEEH